jgi:hypothetical protein
VLLAILEFRCQIAPWPLPSRMFFFSCLQLRKNFEFNLRMHFPIERNSTRSVIRKMTRNLGWMAAGSPVCQNIQKHQD